jgi:hypothetical protein
MSKTTKFIDKVVRHVGRRKLVKRDYVLRGETVGSRYFVASPKPGSPGVISRTWFDHQQTAERALGASDDSGWWEIGSLRTRARREPSEPWKLR